MNAQDYMDQARRLLAVADELMDNYDTAAAREAMAEAGELLAKAMKDIDAPEEAQA